MWTYDKKNPHQKSRYHWSPFWRGFCDCGRVANAWISAGLNDLTWPQGHLTSFDLGRQNWWTSRCSIYEIPCTKLGFNSILIVTFNHPYNFLSSHWLIYYPFGISLITTSLVQKNGLRSRVVKFCLTEIEPIRYFWVSFFLWDHFR